MAVDTKEVQDQPQTSTAPLYTPEQKAEAIRWVKVAAKDDPFLAETVRRAINRVSDANPYGFFTPKEIVLFLRKMAEAEADRESMADLAATFA